MERGGEIPRLFTINPGNRPFLPARGRPKEGRLSVPHRSLCDYAQAGNPFRTPGSAKPFAATPACAHGSWYRLLHSPSCGSTTMNSAPLLLSPRVISPPCALMMCLIIARPSPVPLDLVV